MKESINSQSASTSQRRIPGILAVAVFLFVAWRAGSEVFAAQAGLSAVFGLLANGSFSRFFSKWGLTSLELLIGLLPFVLGIGILVSVLRSRTGAPADRFNRAIIDLRFRFPVVAAFFALLVALIPAFLMLTTYWGDVFTGPFLRLCLLVGAGLASAALLPLPQSGLVSGRAALTGLALVGSLFLIAAQLVTVTAHPFSLSWSEGNRLYENSIFFSGERYQFGGELTSIRRATGRFMLWGLPFLIPGAPIWVHRLWNVLLSTLPHLALGWILANRAGLKGADRLLFSLWSFLFLAQGPIYTPLIVSALVSAGFVHPGKPIQSTIAAAISGYYASLSRWTWLPAVPAWSVFLLLPGAEEKGERPLSLPQLRRLLPAAWVGLAALAGGMLANPKLLQPQKLAESTALSQPLLWYRLWPNATYPLGVLPALFLATSPLVILLIWMIWSGRWRPGRWQLAAHLAAGGVFLIGGIVASVKIGGGNNLHNLDMFLVSLLFVAAAAVQSFVTAPHQARPSQGWVGAMLALGVLLPAWTAVSNGSPLKLPPQESTRKALASIDSAVAEAASQGEVLFLDQRQLLTFGSIGAVDLLPEYEKKYMMDQAMAGNASYFEAFYRDLANHRFSLIVSDMQFEIMKDRSYAFGEENNAWVQWVSRPLLCYYMPLRTLQNVDIQLLVPNPKARDCPGL